MLQQEREKRHSKLPILPDVYYTRAELQAAGVCSWITLLRNEQRGALRASRAGRRVLYRGADVIAWLSSGEK